MDSKFSGTESKLKNINSDIQKTYELMKYKSVIVTKRGGPDVLQVIENDLRPPGPEEVRIKVLAAPVSLPDVEARYGHSPFKLKTPFVPGYAIIGEVDAVGEAVSSSNDGERVAALTVYGGYTEYIYLDESELIPVPSTIDPVAAAPLVLNYLVAYQVLHRIAKVDPDDQVLIIGASGGIGTALLQLGNLAGLRMYGLASGAKHQVLSDYGATAIDYQNEDFVTVIQNAEPAGIDAVFDGIGGAYIQNSFSLMRKGGIYVGYCNPLSLPGLLRYLGKVTFLNLWPNGRSARFYGTGLSRLNRKPFMEDWAALFNLLGEGKINPLIAEVMPLVDAKEANQLLESGAISGNIVLETDKIS
jgi:NADPH:quinone reductase-like Zn-dependent oxidoreductase